MGSYTLKSIGKASDYMTILRDTEDGFVVRIVRDKDGYDEITTDFISKALFDSCRIAGSSVGEFNAVSEGKGVFLAVLAHVPFFRKAALVFAFLIDNESVIEIVSPIGYAVV